MNQRVDIALLNECAKGLPDAQKQLIELQFVPFMTLCKRYAKSNAQANELFQAGFLEIFQYVADFKDKTDPDSWLYECFLKSVIRQLKNNRAEYFITTTIRHDEKKTENTSAQHPPANINDFDTEIYFSALQQLPPAFRAIFNLSVIDNFPISKVSEILEISEYSAANTLDRAKNEFIRTLLSQKFAHA